MKIDPTTVKVDVERLRTSREQARAEVTRAWMHLESAIVDALSGEALRGLPNLGSDRDPFYAMRIYPRDAESLKRRPDQSQWLGELEGWRLVIMRTGRVAFALRDGVHVRWRHPTFDEMRVEDFEPYVKSLARALALNAERVEKTSQRYDATARLATRIAKVVGF